MADERTELLAAHARVMEILAEVQQMKVQTEHARDAALRAISTIPRCPDCARPLKRSRTWRFWGERRE
jgi:hypothetical protein